MTISIAEFLNNANGANRAIDITFNIDDVVIAADKATPFALLLNELVANSMKYAFNERSLGVLSVTLARIDDVNCQLVVADDGPGYDGNAVRPGMGSRLIRAFVLQLQGRSSYTNTDGTTFTATLNIG